LQTNVMQKHLITIKINVIDVVLRLNREGYFADKCFARTNANRYYL